VTVSPCHRRHARGPAGLGVRRYGTSWNDGTSAGAVGDLTNASAPRLLRPRRAAAEPRRGERGTACTNDDAEPDRARRHVGGVARGRGKRRRKAARTMAETATVASDGRKQDRRGSASKINAIRTIRRDSHGAGPVYCRAHYGDGSPGRWRAGSAVVAAPMPGTIGGVVQGRLAGWSGHGIANPWRAGDYSTGKMTVPIKWADRTFR
jgi:hypothetical protein